MASIVLLLPAGFVLAAGLVIHSFIPAVNVSYWLKGKAVVPIDQVLTSLGISRMLIQFFSILDLILSPEFHIDPGAQDIINITIDSLLFFSNYCGIWLATLFSVVFCLKIAIFHNLFYSRLKRIISERIVLLITACVLISICYILMFLWLKNSDINSTNSTEAFLTNRSQVHRMEIRFMFLFTCGNIVPFLIYCMSTILLMISLCLHLNRMKCHNDASVHLDAYYSALKSLFFCFSCYALHVISNLIALYYIYKLGLLWFYIIFNAPPIIHSLFLIHKTSNLRHMFHQILCCMVNCLFIGREMSSTDVVGTVTLLLIGSHAK